MADKSSLRADKKRLVLDILSLMYNATEVYFDTEDKDEYDYAASTLDICKNLLNNINF